MINGTPTPAIIRKARHAARLSQTEAAALIGYTMRAWQEWEGGRRKMRKSLWEMWRFRVQQ